VDFVKVLDFGLVKPRASENAQLTTQFALHGTPAFMAPEQVQGDGHTDGRSDLYAVGCVAYWLLTGRRVFDAETAMQVLVQHVYGTPTPLSERVPQPIPPELDALVMSCLQKDPSNRPQTADALADALAVLAWAYPWPQDRARAWWQEHLPSGTEPFSTEMA
jgi:serine/threonine-protein kinase